MSIGEHIGARIGVTTTGTVMERTSRIATTDLAITDPGTGHTDRGFDPVTETGLDMHISRTIAISTSNLTTGMATGTGQSSDERNQNTQLVKNAGGLPMQKSIFAISAILLLSTTYTMAQQSVASVCAQEIRAACGNVPPGGGAIRSCLYSHLADLTQPCQTLLLGTAAAVDECRSDIRAMCSNIQPGGGRIEACLQSHLTELSAPCVDVMARTVGSGR